MVRQLFSILILTGGLLLAASPVLAHHSIAAEFDTENPITLTGTIGVPCRTEHVVPYGPDRWATV